MSLNVTTNIPVSVADDAVATNWTTTFAETGGVVDNITATFILLVNEVARNSSTLGNPDYSVLFQELVTATGTLSADTYSLLDEVASASDTVASPQELVSTFVEVAKVEDDLVVVASIVYVPTLTEEATASEVISYEVDFTGLLEEAATANDSAEALRDTSFYIDEVARGVSGALLSNPFLTTSLAETATSLEAVPFALDFVANESATAADTITAFSSATARFDERVAVQDGITLSVDTLTLLREYGYGSGVLFNLPPQSVGITGRTVNIETWALSRYTDLAQYEFGNEWALGPNGVYRKGSSAVAAYIETGDMDLTSRGEQTRMLWVDTDAHAATDLALTATAIRTGEAPLTATYTETRNASRVEVFPYKLGRKLRGDRWRLRISNPSGGDFRLLRLILHPVLTV